MRLAVPRGSHLLLLLVAATILVYGRTLGHGFFAWDDDLLVHANPLVQDISWRTFRGIFTTYDPELYVPLTLLTFQAEYAMVGPHPFLYHLTNLLLHALNACLLFFLFRRWALSENVAFASALLFAVHPLNAEPVSWISARKDLLSATFALGALLAWERASEREGWRSLLPSILLFLASLLAKVTTLFLPFVMLARDWRESGRITSASIRRVLPLLALSVLFAMIALGGKTQNISELSPRQTLLIATKSIAASAFLVLAPFRLASLYRQQTAISILHPSVLLSLAALAAAGGLLLLLRRRKAVVFGAWVFLLFLLPSLANFSRMGAVYYASDRYLYLPQIGFLFLLGWMIEWASQRRERLKPMIVTGILILSLPLGAYAFSRSHLWGSSETFFRGTLSQDPGSAILHFNLGVVLQREGRAAESMAEYVEALRISPRYPQALNNAGVLLLESEETESAIRLFEEAIAIDPSYDQGRISLATAYRLQGRMREADEVMSGQFRPFPARPRSAGR